MGIVSRILIVSSQKYGTRLSDFTNEGDLSLEGSVRQIKEICYNHCLTEHEWKRMHTDTQSLSDPTVERVGSCLTKTEQ